MKIGILGATLETPNLGVSTLATGAVSCVHRAFPGAEIFFLDYARQGNARSVADGTFSVDVPLVNMRFSKRFWLSNNIVVLFLAAFLLRLIPAGGLRRWVFGKNTCLREIASADLFAAVSGGDSFSDIYGLARFLYTVLPQVLLLLLGRRLILLPQTYGPFRRRSARLIAQWIVKHAEQAWCRDENSLAQLMNVSASHPRWGDRAFGYDMGFAIEPNPPAQLLIEGLTAPYRRDPGLIGVNVSGLLFQGGYTGRNEFGLRSDYRSLMYILIRALLAHPGTQVLLVPHVLGTENQAESDLLACEQIYKALHGRYPGRIGIPRGSYDPAEMRYLIGLCSFFLGARMHACIAAIAQKVPAVSIAYSDKFLDVMQTIGVERLVADARRMSYQQILEILEDSWASRGEIRRELERTVPEIQRAAKELLVKSEERCLLMEIPAVLV
jgi:colanic acid/amylovoran biosynthesis protein